MIKTSGKIRRATFLPEQGDLPERVWIGVREIKNPTSTHNLFIPIVDESFLKDDPIEWDNEKVYFKGNTHDLLMKSPGIVSAMITKPSFRP
jgi:hypothetical protein